MASYSFVTCWLLDARREPIWEAIYAQERWPEWWRGVEEVEELDGGDGQRVGAVSRMVWRSILPYRVRFEITTTRVERPLLLEGAADGELAGTGRWRLFEQDGVTAVVYERDVATTRAWMNLLAPVARPIFEWNHDWVMARGGEGMARLLGCRLLAGC